MPKVKPLTEDERRRKLLSDTIYAYMGTNHKLSSDVAKVAGISHATFNRRIKYGDFTLPEFERIIKYLHIPQGEILKILDVKIENESDIVGEIRETNIALRMLAESLSTGGRSYEIIR